MMYKKILLILVLFSTLLFSIEVDVEQKADEHTQLDTPTKSYFGEQIFKGNFKENQQFRYNPDYLINIGDIVTVKLWGAYEFQEEFTVDKQGNIFLPKVGEIHLLGLSNRELTDTIKNSVKKTFKDNVYVYADLKNYQPISVFVSGSVQKVGLYNGLSTDSILQFIDKAGGIIRGQGSYRNITILRDKVIIKNIDLYQFLLNGQVDMFQFRNGDVVFVDSVKNFIEVDGDVNRPYVFELLNQYSTVQDVMRFIMPKPTANSFRLTTWKEGTETTKDYPLSQASMVAVNNGEKVKFFSNYYVNTIGITLEGEHVGPKNITVKKGTTLFKLLSKTKFTPLSEIKNVRLYRKSVANIQKQLISTMLKDLEARVLTTGSSTVEEANVMTKESEMVLKFIERAKAVEPLGQVVMRSEDNLDEIYLEEGDRIVIPKRSNIVIVQGEVNIPNALAYREDYDINQYIKVCGGFSARANEEKILLIRANGEVVQYDSSDRSPLVNAGDSILVLGKTDSKNILITSSITKILYQIAVGAAVVLRAF